MSLDTEKFTREFESESRAMVKDINAAIEQVQWFADDPRIQYIIDRYSMPIECFWIV